MYWADCSTGAGVRAPSTPGRSTSARTVTYLPRAGENPRRFHTVTPVAEKLLVMDGAHDVRVSGVGFSYSSYLQPSTDEGYAGTQAGLTLTGESGPVDRAGRYYSKPAAAVVVPGGRHAVVEHGVSAHLGGAGVVFEQGTQNSTLTRSRFSDLSPGAVYVGHTEPLPAAELVGARNTVSYNSVRRIRGSPWGGGGTSPRRGRRCCATTGSGTTVLST